MLGLRELLDLVLGQRIEQLIEIGEHRSDIVLEVVRDRVGRAGQSLIDRNGICLFTFVRNLGYLDFLRLRQIQRLVHGRGLDGSLCDGLLIRDWLGEIDRVCSSVGQLEILLSAQLYIHVFNIGAAAICLQLDLRLGRVESIETFDFEVGVGVNEDLAAVQKRGLDVLGAMVKDAVLADRAEGGA